MSSATAPAYTATPYVLGRTQAEHERLALQAAKLAPFTAGLLDRVGIDTGATCLDVGCGAGDVMELLAQRAGDAGRVIGVDIDRALGHWAMRRLRAAGHRNCEFVEGNVIDAPLARFDVVYARLVLIHADDPVALLRRMWELTGPGGTLIVQDYDLRAIASDPATWLVDEFRRVVLGVFTAHGRPLDAGLRLPRWFADAGIGAPQEVVVDGLVESLAAIAPLLEGVYRSTLPLALEAGLTTVRDSQAWLAELTRCDPQITARHPLLMGAYARRQPSL